MFRCPPPRVLALITSALLCSLTATSSAQVGAELPGSIRFVGVTTTGESPGQWFAPEDLALLITLQQPMTPNEMLRARMAFRFDQIQRLERAGFLVQEGDAFRSTLAILNEERLSVIRDELRVAARQIVGDVRPKLSQLNSTLALDGRRVGFPALVNWLLRERVWAAALAQGRIDLSALVQSQQLAAPERGWYGVLWIAEQAAMPQSFTTYVRDDRVMLTCWVARPGILEPFAREQVDRFLGDLKSEDREVKHPDRYPAFRGAELIDDDGLIYMPAMRWRPEELDSTSALVAELGDALLQSIMRRLPVGDLAADLSSRFAAEAATIGYVELVPLLIEQLIEEGFPMGLAEMPVGGPTASADAFTVAVRDVDRLPHVSGAIIRDLEPIPVAIPIVW